MYRTAFILLSMLAPFSWAVDAPPEKWITPAREIQKLNPFPATPASVKAGAKVYMDNCVSCHGDTGKGDGLLVPSLNVKPANLQDPEEWKHTDGELFWKITTGRQPMPAWGAPEDPALKDQQRWDVVNYLRVTYAPKGTAPVVAIVPTTPDTGVQPRSTPVVATSTLPDSVDDLTPEQYKAVLKQLLKEHKEMKAELSQLKGHGAVPTVTNGTGVGVTSAPASQADVDEVQKQINVINKSLAASKPGTEEFFFSGDAFLTFSSARHNDSTFDAGIAPLILWKPTNNILYEAAFDLGYSRNADGSASTNITLNIADVSVLLTDWLAVGGGIFVTPFGVYHNHFDPPWINKFADDPLVFGDAAIAPGSSMGIFARGAELIGSSKVTYDLYVVNGPSLVTGDPGTAGQLNFDPGTDLNSEKAFGGRLGFIPIPNMELGYSIMAGRVNPGGFEHANAVLQAFDFNYRPDVPALGGTFDLRSEWVFSNVGQTTFDRDGKLGFGPTRFRNARDGGYVQLCYRPTHSNSEIIRSLEFCTRWDIVRVPKAAPGGGTESRFTFGVNYWVNPQAVLKFDYEIDHRNGSLGDAQNAFLFQLGLGL